jgi:hypothetical protein
MAQTDPEPVQPRWSSGCSRGPRAELANDEASIDLADLMPGADEMPA